MNPLDGLADDMRDHIERETRENIERGMSPAEARRAALRKFGNVARAMEETRDVWRRVWLEQLFQDVRYGLRFLRRNPRFAAVVVLTLALGIGVNTAVFSVVNAVLLKPLAHPHPERLVWLGTYEPHLQRDMVDMASFYKWREQASSYDGMAAFGYQQAVLRTPRSDSQITGVYGAGDFWKVTGAHALLGRLFDLKEKDCLVLSWGLFQREFGGDAQIVGRPVMMNGRQALVTGVLPHDFRLQFPMWWVGQHPVPVEAYFSAPPEQKGRGTQVVAALRPGVSPGQALAELKSIEKQAVHVDRLQDQLTGSSRQALLVLLAAGAFVLLIATINVANLLLARATLRQREVAVRTAVGAGRSRVTRQLLVESIIQALAGGAAGVLLARWAIYALVRLSPFAVPRLAETTIDARVLGFTLGVSVLTGTLFGTGPAISLWRRNLHDALRSGGRSSGGAAGLRLRKVLVAVELSLAIVLLTGAGVMLKSYARMNAHVPGVDPAKVMVLKVGLGGAKYRDKAAQQAYMHAIERKLESAPGVQASGVSMWSLFASSPAFPADADPSARHVVRINAASTGYLQAMGMKLLKGRWLTERDTDAALLNEGMARQVFGTADPIGRQFTADRRETVAGVVSDVKYSKLDAPAPPEIFITPEASPFLPTLDLAARIEGKTDLRKLIAEIDPAQPVYDAKTLDQALAESIAPRRFNLFLLASFAVAALLLAVVGIYGVAAYSVAERTREIGVRMALGARRAQVAGMVVREALPIALAGIAAGLAAAWSLSRLLASLLYDAQANDPAIFLAVAILLGLTTVAACVGPALKAASIDPTVALRYE